ncbi:hypothetical protein [Vibrio diazotrophicus]|uniref:hypothetical protein n=1 Tax=Vibrio diazotrophicus TaxID=685 RepID=UPI00142D71A2|nr:hypothetical protein [Vibrio diazotrophicus]NIY94628.1 hypothetical protein [Vibrio diazotrophicus]
MSGNDTNSSKELVIIINSVAAFIMIFALKFAYGTLYLNLMESGSDRSWVIGSIVSAFVVTTVCVGLFLRKEIARKVAIGGSVLGLFIFPVGTLVSIVFALCLVKNKAYYK